MGTVNDKINYLEETKTLIKNALISKGIDVSDEDTFRSYVQKIIDYNGIDTSDATATAIDIADDKTAYVNGEKITGNVKTTDKSIQSNPRYFSDKPYDGVLKWEYVFENPILFRQYARLVSFITYESLNNKTGMTADMLLKGVNILGLEGIATSDATATAEDILEGKTAYVDGEKITGTATIGGSDIEITDASRLFYMNARIDSLEALIKTFKNITSASYMFYGSNNLTEVPLFDTSNVTDMSSMFYNCKGLTSVPAFDTSKVTTTNNMFYGCSYLTEIPGFDTSNVTDMQYMFYSAYNIVTIPVIKCDKVTKISGVITRNGGVPNTQNLGGFQNLGKAYVQKTNNYSAYKLDLSSQTVLTHDSLMNVINNLYDLNLTYDVANGGTLYTQSLTLGSTNTAKLTEEEIAICNSKGWSVS